MFPNVQDALEILEEHAVYRGDINAEARSLAFRRGSATLKCLPTKISCMDHLRGLPYIDVGSATKPGHCKRVIMVRLPGASRFWVYSVLIMFFRVTWILLIGYNTACLSGHCRFTFVHPFNLTVYLAFQLGHENPPRMFCGNF